MNRAVWIVYFAALVYTADVDAQVFKCRSVAGEVSMQTSSCPPAWKLEESGGDAELVAIFRAFENMREKMKKGDVEGALSHFTQGGAIRMRKVFERLGVVSTTVIHRTAVGRLAEGN